MTNLQDALFSTNALKVADSDKPFWYTSGMLGPFFINTHFLYGSMDDAEALLDFINNAGSPVTFFPALTDRVTRFYQENRLYHDVINTVVESIQESLDATECDIVSGGERRDWFFSPVIASLLNKPHLYIKKDLSVYDNKGINVTSITGKKVLHVADLVTQASSYVRSWIPAIDAIGGTVTTSSCVVDRCQEGSSVLSGKNIISLAAVKIDSDFFKSALEKEIITDEQVLMIESFTADPAKFGRTFLLEKREYLEQSLAASDASTSSKAAKCLSENPYGFKEDFIKSFS
jgi:orotate phosphoribosyltransferase